ncbi:hypothetical protein [Mobiluncus mulieris]|nr:hypothetical protein [Mobiluncus mulieris]
MSLTKGIPFTKQVLKEALQDASATQRRFLYNLFTRETESRAEARRVRLIRAARFPARKTLTGYDWSAITWPPD